MKVLAHYTFRNLKSSNLPDSQAFYCEASQIKQTRNFLKRGQIYLAMQIAKSR